MSHVNSLFSFNLEIRQRGRFAGFSLLVSDTATMENSSLCYKDGPLLPPLNFTSTCITSGRYVTFYNERLIGDKYPYGYENESVYTELCEVIVHGREKFYDISMINISCHDSKKIIDSNKIFFQQNQMYVQMKK